MAHPNWVLKYKTKNTEIRLIKGRYYLYERLTKYCPKKKRARKITGKYLGRITEHGFITKGSRRVAKIDTNFMEDFQNLDDPLPIFWLPYGYHKRETVFGYKTYR